MPINVNQDVSFFDEEGYVLIKDVFDRATIAKWRQKFLQDLHTKQTRLMVDTAITYPELRDALAAPKLSVVLHQLLGQPFVILPLSSVDHGRFGGVHTDT